MSNPQVLIMYPNSQTSCMLGRYLVSELANVSFYVPSEVHEQCLHTIIEEVQIESFGLKNVSVSTVADLEGLNNYDFVIFPYLNLLASKSTDKFALMCANLFT